MAGNYVVETRSWQKKENFKQSLEKSEVSSAFRPGGQHALIVGRPATTAGLHANHSHCRLQKSGGSMWRIVIETGLSSDSSVNIDLGLSQIKDLW